MNNDADMNNDALDRLRNRQRPTVPNRDATINPRIPDIPISRNQDSQLPDTSTSRGSEIFQSKDPEKPTMEASQPPTLKEISNRRHPDIEISTVPDIEKLDTKQSTLRMEADLSDRLQTLCRSQGICREVLLEALFEHFESHPDTQPEILAAAQSKNEHRQHIANLKRAQSMMKRFSGRS